MKLLFVCNSIDRELKNLVNVLKLYDLEVDIFDLLTYKLVYHNGKEIYVRPKSKYKILEYFFVLDEINEYHRRKEIFGLLDMYDTVYVYKSEYFAQSLIDEIKNISTRYVLTPNENFLKTSNSIEKLAKNAKGLIFFSEFAKQKFCRLYSCNFNSKVLNRSILLLKVYDEIEFDVLEKFKKHLELDERRKNIFCEFSGSKLKQRDFVIKLVNLPQEIKRKTTYFIYLKDKDNEFNKKILLFLESKKLDYIILNNKTQNEQLAMLIKLSDASVFIDGTKENDVFLLSLYSSIHTYLFHPKGLDKIFKDEKIFIDNFDQYHFFFEKDEFTQNLQKEYFKNNVGRIKELFHPEVFCQKYLQFVVDGR